MSSALAREQIAAAATRLLEENRFHELTVEAVMHEAGISRTVFYRHFAGISDVVVRLVEDVVAKAVLQTRSATSADPGLMRSTLGAVVGLFREHGGLLLAFDDAARHDPRSQAALRLLMQRSVDAIADLFETGVKDGRIDPLPARGVAEALCAMNARYLLDLVAREPDFDAFAATDALWTVWSRTIWPGSR